MIGDATFPFLEMEPLPHAPDEKSGAKGPTQVPSVVCCSVGVYLCITSHDRSAFFGPLLDQTDLRSAPHQVPGSF